jgi:hypothetical protein
MTDNNIVTIVSPSSPHTLHPEGSLPTPRTPRPTPSLSARPALAALIKFPGSSFPAVICLHLEPTTIEMRPHGNDEHHPRDRLLLLVRLLHPLRLLLLAALRLHHPLLQGGFLDSADGTFFTMNLFLDENCRFEVLLPPYSILCTLGRHQQLWRWPPVAGSVDWAKCVYPRPLSSYVF